MSRSRRIGRLLRRGLKLALLTALVLFFVAPLVLTAVYRFLPPPVTPLMLIRLAEGEGLDRRWVALDSLPRHVPAAVIAAEDNRFCRHGGIDWQAVDQAVADYEESGRLRGASTLSMQTARNLFLWPGGGFVRKGIEAVHTLMIEALWPKRRILEVYLNIAEWGPGIYGIEAAARHHFGRPARALTRRQAALLAVALPAPRQRSAGRPSARTSRRAALIAGRAGQIRPLLDCF